ncbi:hypothetical protein [Methylobacter tundripaludum]|uniref:Putative membrane-associated oxidoreductase n=1 Tax=Methylobacter tundripaludum (strain ATCC BAA-1195 / DSM 17260 / SV96) TaxID=697282 RepID=G3IY00_METTV|nr:hypothetical protein [Methylobacter tundripaludum]EGW21097.1 putative membrane-associated oxidoreductase [Methylobacter tundripaludum SV96]
MVNPPLKPDGRTLAYFGQLKPAEKKLLDACRSGEIAHISERERRPEGPSEQNIVRASFLRFLALGGDEYAPVHEKGVQLYEAWVDGKLDIEGAISPNSLRLTYCHLNTTPNLRDSVVHGCLLFQVCHIEGLEADRMVCSGTIFLNNVISTSEVSFAGAQIGGDLVCDGGKFDGKEGNALICDRARIKGCVFLRNEFSSTGEVAMIGAQIGGDLVCENGQFVVKDGNALSCDGAVIKGCVVLKNGFTATGTVRLQGAKIGGDLECSDSTLDGNNGFALLAENMTVAGVFFFLNLRVKGTVFLVSAKVGSLVDDLKSWPEGKLDLDGFVYGRLSGTAPTDTETRLKWLKKQPTLHLGQIGDGKDFKPQPWWQLQKVLRDMGHLEYARQVAIAFEDQLRTAKLIGQTPEDWCKPIARIYRFFSRGFHWLFGWLIGYGYRPLGLFFKMVVVWLFCGAVYWGAAVYGNNGNGVFAPSNPLVFQNTKYAACVPDSCAAKEEKIKLVYATLQKLIKPNNLLMFQNTECVACMSDSEVAKAELAKSACAVLPPIQGAGNWYLCSKLPEEYTGFSPFAYSLDLILPLVDLQQEHDWAPMISTPTKTSAFWTWSSNYEYCIRFLIWFEILFGWMSSLLLVAVVSGLTKRREE